MLTLINTGENNTGIGNSGNYNSGNYNSGNYNSGNYNSSRYNSGNHNSGNHNSGDSNSGDFNTIIPDNIFVFNKPVSRKEYDVYEKPVFLFFDMNEYDENGNITKTLGYKEAFIKSWENADIKDRMRIKECPNFDNDIFFEISGIDVRKYEKECME